MSVTKKIRKAQKYLEKKKTWKNLRDNLRKNVLGYVRTHAATLLYSGLCNYFVCKLKYLGKKLYVYLNLFPNLWRLCLILSSFNL